MDIPRKKINVDLNENNSYQEISETDSKIYDFLDSHLEKENSDSFSLGFSKNIIRKIEAKQQRRFNIKIYILTFILILMSIPMFISFFNKEFISIILSTFSNHHFIVIFVPIAIILIQFGEKFISSDKNIR